MNVEVAVPFGGIICDTDTFWEKMCHPGFFRISLNTGKIGNEQYFTETPPEKVPGFFEKVLESIVADLRLYWIGKEHIDEETQKDAR